MNIWDKQIHREILQQFGITYTMSIATL